MQTFHDTSGKLALQLCWPFRDSFSPAIHLPFPCCTCLMATSIFMLFLRANQHSNCVRIRDYTHRRILSLDSRLTRILSILAHRAVYKKFVRITFDDWTRKMEVNDVWLEARSAKQGIPSVVVSTFAPSPHRSMRTVLFFLCQHEGQLSGYNSGTTCFARIRLWHVGSVPFLLSLWCVRASKQTNRLLRREDRSGH